MPETGSVERELIRFKKNEEERITIQARLSCTDHGEKVHWISGKMNLSGCESAQENS